MTLNAGGGDKGGKCSMGRRRTGVLWPRGSEGSHRCHISRKKITAPVPPAELLTLNLGAGSEAIAGASINSGSGFPMETTELPCLLRRSNQSVLKTVVSSIIALLKRSSGIITEPASSTSPVLIYSFNTIGMPLDDKISGPSLI